MCLANITPSQELFAGAAGLKSNVSLNSESVQDGFPHNGKIKHGRLARLE